MKKKAVKKTGKKGPVKKESTRKAKVRKNFSVEIFGGAPSGHQDTVKKVGDGIYWIGEENDDPFHCNPYLIVEGDESLVVDPGGLLYSESVLEKISSIVKLSSIKYIIAHHQDPDVCSALNAFRPHVDKDCVVVTHSRIAVLIKHFGSGFDFYSVDKSNMELRLGNRQFKFAHTPYLHSPGAIVTYDERTSTVFTSDLFGGITENWSLYGGDTYADSVVSFHGGYMPSNEILQNGLNQIKKLGPINTIMPQHGSIIRKEYIDRIFETVENLQVGLYADEAFSETLKKQQEALRMRQMVETANLNLMAADENGKIVYLNPQSINTFKQLEKFLPVKAEEIKGQSFDIFHKDPSYQQNMLVNPESSFPRKRVISMGEEKLELNVCAVYDESGKFIGPMVSWEVITDRVKKEERDDSIREKIVETTTHLKKASEEMKEVSLSMSSSANETSAQADTVSEFSVTISGNINTVVTSMEGMTESITEISKNASAASGVVNEAVAQADSANKIISTLGVSSKEIGEVIKVINSITQQTNLLALNARIEAARAGEAGKGFAVVANEVKDLAKETAKSTKDITDKVEKIQRDTDEAVRAIKNISGVINKVDDITHSIAGAVEEQSVTSSEIQKNVAQAAKGIDEISRNISGVAEAATETSKGAERTSKSATSLSGQADNLKGIVEEFS